MRMTPWCLLLLPTARASLAAPDCPRGDDPGEVGDLVVERVQTHVDVVGDAAAIRTEITLRNTSDGPARGSVTLATGLDDDTHPPLIVQRARLMGGDRAVLDDSSACSALASRSRGRCRRCRRPSSWSSSSTPA